MKTLAVYTPTYNRKDLLERCFRSLTEQTSKDFLWLVVDDGSTDGTEKLIEELIEKNEIEISYYKKENGGKHTATNLAFEKAECEYIALALDSDDILKPDAVGKILETLSAHRDCAGCVFMKEDTSGKVLGTFADENLSVASWQKALSEERFDGESLLVLKSSYAKRFSYPVIEGEKFFTEAYVYLQMDEPFFWSRESVYVAEYRADGYSRNILSAFAENPVCYRMYADIRCRLYRSPAKRCKYAAYYCAFSILSKKKRFLKEASRPFLAALMLPFGICFAAALKLKKRS